MVENKSYYVVGGEYADMTFTAMAEGKAEERHGPYSEKQAMDAWRALTARTVDHALFRYSIKPAEELDGAGWYVVGGEYASTAFNRIAPGHQLEVYGPFSRSEAFAAWRAIAAKTVDNAMARYNIVTTEELEALKVSAGQVGDRPS